MSSDGKWPTLKKARTIWLSVNSDYSEFIGAVAVLIWNAHTERGILLEKISEDLNQAVKLLTEMYEESD